MVYMYVAHWMLNSRYGDGSHGDVNDYDNDESHNDGQWWQ